MSDSENDITALLVRHRDALLRFLTKEAAGLLRYESEEDLAQGVHMRALKAREHFEYMGEAAFLGWLWQVARQQISDRHAYWSALKRDAGKLMRVSAGPGDSAATASGFEPPASMTGPLTFADRRDRMRTAMQALDTLRPRDRQLIELSIEGVSLAATGERLGMGYDAVQQARGRAFDRFRRAFEALETRS